MPHPQHVWFRFMALTAAIFIRRRVIHERDMFFDTRWRDLGDLHWVMAMMKNKVPMVVFDRYTSAFALTGWNQYRHRNGLPCSATSIRESTHQLPLSLRGNLS